MENNFKLFAPPLPVGKYEIVNGFSIHTVKKPAWFYRKMTRFLLGWKWYDNG